MHSSETWVAANRNPDWRLDGGQLMHANENPWWSFANSPLWPTKAHVCWEQTHLCGTAMGYFDCLSRCPCGAWQATPVGDARPGRWYGRREGT